MPSGSAHLHPWEEIGRHTSNRSLDNRQTGGRLQGERTVEEQFEQLRERLERAERELAAMRSRSRRLRWLAVFAVVAAIAFIMMQPTARQVQAAQSLAGRP